MTLSPEDRKEIEALLPFHANGTLAGEEAARVEAALAQDEALRAELEVLQVIREQMQGEQVQSPGEFGLARLMRDVAAEDRVTPVSATPANDVATDLVPRRRLQIWQIAAALVLAIGLGQSVLLLRGPVDQGVDLASGEVGTDAPAAFVVGFDPDATEAEIRTLLFNAGVEIVAGPSALGLYQLAPVNAEARDAAALILADAEGGVIETLDVME